MSPPRRKVEQGERYGSMVIVSELEPRMINDRSRRIFLMKCECGSLSAKSIHSLRVLKSCSYSCPYRRRPNRMDFRIPRTIYTPEQFKEFELEWERRGRQG